MNYKYPLWWLVRLSTMDPEGLRAHPAGAGGLNCNR